MRNEAGVIAVLFGSLFLATVDNQLLIPLLPTLNGEFGIPIGQLGWLFSLYALSAAVFNLLIGPLTDRYGRVPFLLFGLLTFVGISLLMTQTRSFADLLGLRALAGLAGGMLSTCTAGLVGDLFSYERRGRVMGFVLSSYFVALILGIPLGSWIGSSFGWRNIFWFSAGGGALLLLLSSLVWKRGGSLKRDSKVEVPFRLRDLLASRSTASGLVISFLVSGGTLAFLTFISGHLSEGFELSAVQISSVFLVAGLAAGVASPISGWLSDRWTKRRVFLLSNTILVLPLVLLDRLGCGVLLFSSLFLISLCIAFRQTALQTLQTELVPMPQRGTYLAIRNTFSQLGISASVFLAGFLYGDFGYGAVTWLAAALTVTASLVLFFLVPEPGRTEDSR